MPARPRLAMTMRRPPTSVVRHHQVEVAHRVAGADDQQALVRQRCGDGTRDVVGSESS